MTTFAGTPCQVWRGAAVRGLLKATEFDVVPQADQSVRTVILLPLFHPFVPCAKCHRCGSQPAPHVYQVPVLKNE